MALRNDILKHYSSEASTVGIVSINDLRDREFSGEPLSADEIKALRNFDKYRLDQLNNIQNDKEFHEKYRQIQVMANLGDWKDFLNL
jgi:hypothetical protein